MRIRATWLLALFALTVAACTPHHRVPRSISTGATATDVLELHRSWWRAIATSDSGYLRAHSTPALVATLSGGQKHDLESLVRTFGTSRRTPHVECTDESVQHLDASTALVTSDCTESSGQYSTTYRFLSFLTKSGQGWRVSVAQSTSRAAFTRRTNDLSSLADFAGSYRTPRGLALQVEAGNDFLTMIEPSGLKLRLDPIGPNLFEADTVAPGGWITRYSFDRDRSGAVVSLSVLSPGSINTFPKK